MELFDPETHNILISSKPNWVNDENPMSQKEQSERHDRLLSQIGELENKLQMKIISGRGQSEEWGPENSIALSNVPEPLIPEILGLAEEHKQDSILHSPSGTGQTEFLKPDGEVVGRLEEGGFTEKNPPAYTEFPTGQKYAYGQYTSNPIGSGFVEMGEPMEIAFQLLKEEDETPPKNFGVKDYSIMNRILMPPEQFDHDPSVMFPRECRTCAADIRNFSEGVPMDDKQGICTGCLHPESRDAAFDNAMSNPTAEEPQFGDSWQEKNASEPMEIAFRLLKERVSPEARQHKLEYDTKYESSPKRVKYREDLNRERRRRGIYGTGGGKDVSHTEGGKLTLEGIHSNRARHFKDKGTLRHAI